MPTSRLYHEERSPSPALVLLHGFPFDHTLWTAQLAELGDSVRVLAPDLPGFGTSAALRGAATMDSLARAVLGWADGLGLDRFVLAGHSMGGYVALALARLAPTRLRGLALVSTRSGADNPAAQEGRAQLAAAITERGLQAAVDAMLPKLLGPEADRAQPALRERVADLMLRQPPGGSAEMLRAMAARPDSTPLLPRLPGPVLVLHGAGDATIPPSEATAMAAAIPHATLVLIPGVGHLPMLETPAAVNSALRALLGMSTHDATRGA